MMFSTTEKYCDKRKYDPIMYKSLLDSFKYIVEDFAKPITDDCKFDFVKFASKVIYEIIPEAKKSDKKWIFNFKYEVSGKVNVRKISIRTYKNDKESYTLSDDKNLLKLTPELALLLSVECICKLIDFYPGSIYLTPSSLAFVHYIQVNKAAAKMKMTTAQFLKILNCSSQRNGYLLPYSTHACALACTIAIIKSLPIDKKQLETVMIENIKRSYHSVGKMLDVEEFKMWKKQFADVFLVLSIDELENELGYSGVKSIAAKL